MNLCWEKLNQAHLTRPAHVIFDLNPNFTNDNQFQSEILFFYEWLNRSRINPWGKHVVKSIWAIKSLISGANSSSKPNPKKFLIR